MFKAYHVKLTDMKNVNQKSFTFLTFVLLIIISLTKTGCRKSEHFSDERDADIIEKFLKIPANASPAIKSIAADLRAKDLKRPFIESLAESKGFPNWEKVIIKDPMQNGVSSMVNRQASNTSTDTFALIPLVQNDERVSSLINCKLSDSISYKLFSGSDYWKAGFNSNTYNASNFVGLMLLMENQIFDREYFILKDGRLFKSNVVEPDSAKKQAVAFKVKPPTTGSNEFVASTTSTYIEIEMCYDVYAPCSGQVTGCPPNDPNCNSYCTTTTCVTLASWWNYNTLEWLEDPTNPMNGGSGNGGGGGSPNGNNYGWIPTVEDITNIVSLLQNLLGLDTQQASWLELHPDRTMEVVRYLQESNSPTEGEKSLYHINKMINDEHYYSFVQNYASTNSTNLMWWENNSFLVPYGGIGFGSWAINYLIANSSVPFTTFQNHFMTPAEGQDGYYDTNYWDNPSLAFPPQNLPSWNSFSSAYPKHSDALYNTPEKLYTSIGGEVATLYNNNPTGYQNTCALRISKALNYAGVNIPAGVGRYQGADGKYYFLSCVALLKWMKKTFGTPSGSNYLTGSQGGTNGENFPGLLANAKGIYIMIPNYPGGCANGTGFCASGHSDMIENGICDGGCYFDAVGGVKEIFIWQLQ
jgi:hypothetical protein